MQIKQSIIFMKLDRHYLIIDNKINSINPKFKYMTNLNLTKDKYIHQKQNKKKNQLRKLIK